MSMYNLLHILDIQNHKLNQPITIMDKEKEKTKEERNNLVRKSGFISIYIYFLFYGFSHSFLNS